MWKGTKASGRVNYLYKTTIREKSFIFLPAGQVLSDEHHALFLLLESPRKKKFENAAASARNKIK